VEALALVVNLWLIMSNSIRGVIMKVRIFFAKRHLSKWRMLHLRERAKGRVLRKRRNKKRAKKISKYDYGSELEED
jgi:hypothetical protein